MSEKDKASSPTGRLTCKSCGQPLRDEVYLLAGQPCCPRCTGFLQIYREMCRFSLKPFLRALIVGILAMIPIAILWAWAAGSTSSQRGMRQDGIGMLSIFLAAVVSKVVIMASGRRRGPSIQLLAVGISILGILIAKGLIAAWSDWPAVQNSSFLAGVGEPLRRVLAFILGFIVRMRTFDILWYALAFFIAWSLARLPNFPVSGPHRPEDLQLVIARGRGK